MAARSAIACGQDSSANARAARYSGAPGAAKHQEAGARPSGQVRRSLYGSYRQRVLPKLEGNRGPKLYRRALPPTKALSLS